MPGKVRFVVILDQDNKPSDDLYVVALEKPTQAELLQAVNAWDGRTKSIAKQRFMARRLQSVTVKRDGVDYPGGAYVLVS